MHTRIFFFVLIVIAFILWTFFYWLFGPSKSSIYEDYFNYTEGEVEGVFTKIELSQYLTIDGKKWMDQQEKYEWEKNKIIDSLHKGTIDSIPPTVEIFIKDAKQDELQSFIDISNNDSSLGSGDFGFGKWELGLFIAAEFGTYFKIKGSEKYYYLDSDLFAEDIDLEDWAKDRAYYYFRRQTQLDSFLSQYQMIGVHTRKDYQKGKIQKVYSIYDEDLIAEDENALERLGVKYERDEFDDLMEVENSKFVVWYNQWTYQWVSGLMALMAFFNLIGFLRLSTRKAKWYIKIEGDEKNWKWKILDKRKSFGPFNILIENLEVIVLYENKEKDSLKLRGIVFMNRAEDSYYHYSMNDYILNPKMLKLVEDLPEDKLKSFQVDNVSESSTDYKNWSHSYLLTNGETLEFESTYLR